MENAFCATHQRRRRSRPPPTKPSGWRSETACAQSCPATAPDLRRLERSGEREVSRLSRARRAGLSAARRPRHAAQKLPTSRGGGDMTDAIANSPTIFSGRCWRRRRGSGYSSCFLAPSSPPGWAWVYQMPTGSGSPASVGRFSGRSAYGLRVLDRHQPRRHPHPRSLRLVNARWRALSPAARRRYSVRPDDRGDVSSHHLGRPWLFF